jgi:FMN phosphatase YigB (HAD superfamily)
VDAVLFDFQGTLATTEDPVEAVTSAAAACGATLAPRRVAALAEALTAAGRVGGPTPAIVPAELAQAWAARDLDPAAHRTAYAGLAATVAPDIEGFGDAVYARLLQPAGWRVYADAVSTLVALRAAGARIGVVSNVGWDIRAVCRGLGLGQHVDAWTLSGEVGALKPSPAIFQAACRLLEVEPAHTIMVGDTVADAGAVDIGCRALIVPAAPPGAVNGLSAVLTLYADHRDHRDHGVRRVIGDPLTRQVP